MCQPLSTLWSCVVPLSCRNCNWIVSREALSGADYLFTRDGRTSTCSWGGLDTAVNVNVVWHRQLTENWCELSMFNAIPWGPLQDMSESCTWVNAHQCNVIVRITVINVAIRITLIECYDICIITGVSHGGQLVTVFTTYFTKTFHVSYFIQIQPTQTQCLTDSVKMLMVT